MNALYTIIDAGGRPVPPARIRAALRRQRAADPYAYVEVFGTDSISPRRVLVSDHNADNVVAVVGGSTHVCAC